MRPLRREDRRPASLRTAHRLLLFLVVLALGSGTWSVSAYGAEPVLLLVVIGIIGTALLTLGTTS